LLKTQALRAKDTVSGRAFSWSPILFTQRLWPSLQEEWREGRFQIKADAVFGPEMCKTAFSARETVQKPMKICGERMSFSCRRLHFEQNKNINSVDIDKFTAPD